MPLLTREDHERAEAQSLAPYACRAAQSQGRDHATAPDRLRTDFQRDRDRIIHCSAFRKLEFKTQVHVLTAGDYYRTRLTHTMEVAQIARTLARALAANADLAEAIALSHDLGHTPFGHAGEDGMKIAMKDHGGFEHNEQGLRTVELLEERYGAFPGLNLTFEVREGIIKHDTDYDKPSRNDRFAPGLGAPLEAQICDLADEIAYNNADLDDALKMGLIEIDDLRDVPWVFELFERATTAGAPDKYARFSALGRLYDLHVDDVLATTARRLDEARPQSPDDVRRHPGRLADFSPDFKSRLRLLKDFLLDRVYLHPTTLRNSHKAKVLVQDLFAAYLNTPRLLPLKYQKRIATDGLHRTICDYISGMTDRFFNEQYAAIFLPEPTR